MWTQDSNASRARSDAEVWTVDGGADLLEPTSLNPKANSPSPAPVPALGQLGIGASCKAAAQCSSGVCANATCQVPGRAVRRAAHLGRVHCSCWAPCCARSPPRLCRAQSSLLASPSRPAGPHLLRQSGKRVRGLRSQGWARAAPRLCQCCVANAACPVSQGRDRHRLRRVPLPQVRCRQGVRPVSRVHQRPLP